MDVRQDVQLGRLDNAYYHDAVNNISISYFGYNDDATAMFPLTWQPVGAARLDRTNVSNFGTVAPHGLTTKLLVTHARFVVTTPLVISSTTRTPLACKQL